MPGILYNWNGNGWTKVVPPSPTEDFRAVWGTGPNDAWTVTGVGRASHWDGMVWSPLTRLTTSDLRGVWGPTPNEFWAVGDDSRIFRWDGMMWGHELAAGAAFGSKYSIWGPPKGMRFIPSDNGVILQRRP